MTVRATPRLRIALLNWFLDNNEPLAGDLIEECAHRSRTWFWRQLMFALLARTAAGAAAALRDPARLVAPLASLAMFMVLCFQVVVAGSLLASVLPRTRVAGHEWLALVVLLSLPVGWATGNLTRRLHARSRVATVVLCGASAAVIGLVTHSVLTSAGAVIFPALGVQAMAAMVFVSGLVVGADSGWFKRDRVSARTERRSQRSYRT
jgi:hypothetical protein